MSSDAQSLTARRLIYAGALSTALAVVVNLAVYVISRSLFNVDYVIPPPVSGESFTISATNVALDTVIMVVGATLVFALVARMSPRPIRVFLIMSVFVLLLSFMFPLLLQVDAPMKLTLCLMHILAAVIIVGTFARLGH